MANNAATPISNAITTTPKLTNTQVLNIIDNYKIHAGLRSLVITSGIGVTPRKQLDLATIDFDNSENQIMTKTVPNAIYIPRTGKYEIIGRGYLIGQGGYIAVCKNDLSDANTLMEQTLDNSSSAPRGTVNMVKIVQLTEGDVLYLAARTTVATPDPPNATTAGGVGNFPYVNNLLQVKWETSL